MCASLIGHHDQKVRSREVFFSDTSPLSSPYPSGASIFVYPPFSSKLRHSPTWSAMSSQGQKPHRSRGLGSVEESGEWANKEEERLSPTAPEHNTFYKRMRPTKDSGELSSPKTTGETFSKAKEHPHNLQRTESQTQGATLGNSKTSQSHTKSRSTNTRKSLQDGQQATSTLRLKDFPSRESMDDEKKNCKGANPEIRRRTQGTEGRGERHRSGHEQEKTVMVVTQHHKTSSREVKESDKGKGTDFGQRDANGRSKLTEDRNTSKETINKSDTMSPIKDMCRKKGSVVSPKEAKGRQDTFIFSKEDNSKVDIVASVNSLPGSPQSPKGPISPGPWKVPSSARILSQAEVLRDAF